MTYQIDQSGKIEHSSQVTVVAIANGQSKSIYIGAKEKQKLIKSMREIDFPKKNYVFKIFATLIYLLINDLKINTVGIDKEYVGHESVIKDFLNHLFSKNHQKSPEIKFILVGKKSPAHRIALSVFQKNKKPDIIAKSEEVLEVIYDTKKRWRSRSCRDSL